jgi:hypothetical protein
MPTELCSRRRPHIERISSRRDKVHWGFLLAVWGLAMILISLWLGVSPGDMGAIG